jgi:polysaccharide export outer membrane protein
LLTNRFNWPFAAGSVYLREELRQREQQQLDSLTERLRGDLALLTLRSAGSVSAGASALDTQSAAQAILADLSAAEAVGRLVIDLPFMLENADNLSLQVRLENRDELLIPDRTQDVTIIGEVFFPTSHLYTKNIKRDEYIDQSGGLAPSGSKKNIYVVRANGAVIGSGGRFSKQQRIQPGDTIVVPLDTDKGFRLRSVASVTTILYNIAIAVAAINGLSN